MKLAAASPLGAVLLTLLTAANASVWARDCREPKLGSAKAPLSSPPLARIVTGTGRLQFYSAPDEHCPIRGIFVVPGDSLAAYSDTDDGWSSVMYITTAASGWVRSARLKTTGTLAPNQ